MKNKIKKYVSEDNSIDVFTEINIARTSTGKYSYGNLCDHWLVKSVGSLSSIAPGTEVVPNHSIECNSIHPFLYWGSQNDGIFPYTYSNNYEFYFPNVIPKGRTYKLKRITIGNDVWLGQNVIITNGANIGNGVIAAAE